ncbi:phosphotransferase family protein [Rhabdobacter roseus]|uniref:Aminoglycoside phosphotransferase (APT) family kinase protein n=1 Tax=Rhabdobacter roseus TaxID=1655419 RepID=A0A840TX18_9BACT|nr:phosphotransferase family protein [Rhabdobacter roseus]MBB5284758.1 aminoglycoside phosphotransferase (APT) family kinase protein [Rhabdobacter roseus]
MTQLPLDTAAPVRPGEEINLTALNKYLAEAEVPPIVAVQQFPGGYSNLTYFLQTQDQRGYVLRRPPFGAEHIRRGHDMGREYRVLTLLQQAGYAQVPRPVLFCDDVHVLGAPFYLMERVPGLILRAATAPTLGLSPAQLRGASEALVDNLVALHSLDLHQTGLLQLGKPEGYVRRQVEGWYQRYQAAQTDDLPAIERLYQWLVKAMPAENTPTLLHNDYKYDNLVLNPADLTDLRAVLDWEMCTVGDPLMDVGTALSYWAEAGDGPFEKSFNLTWLPGNLTRQAFADRYAERSGRDLSAILYYYVFGLFKNSVVMQQIYARWKKGLTQDKRFAGLLLGIQSLSSTAERALERGRL